MTKRKRPEDKLVSLDTQLQVQLRAAAEPVHVTEIRIGCAGYTWPSVRNALWRLHRAGVIMPVAPRRWQAVP